MFGVNSSPFQAQFVAQSHAEKNKTLYPLAAETVLKSTYMDDSMDSVPDLPTAKELYDQLSELWRSAGMHARKWLSNSPELLRCIPAADCATVVDLDKGLLPKVKTLGVLWDPVKDVFTFSVNPPDSDYVITKRSFLQRIASLFDPLGFLAPFTIRAKMLIQEMWAAGLDWDSPTSPELSAAAHKWFAELSELTDIRVPRCLREPLEVTALTLHTFVDASQNAYGAIVYSHQEYTDKSVTCRLIAAKSRVAPLNSVSIPRLELVAAVVGLRLTVTVSQVLDITSSDWCFWSDSLDVLYWIRGQSRQFKPFVANRVGEIQTATDPSQWRYVPTEINPADFVSRGMSVSKLITEESWWSGPPFLVLPPADWPENKVDTRKEHDCEIKKQFRDLPDCKIDVTLVTALPTKDPDDRLEPSRYSSWVRMKHVFARVARFVNNCRLPRSLRVSGALGPEEICDAETHYIKFAQHDVFMNELQVVKCGKPLHSSSRLLPLKPMICDDGLLHCDGRLQYADCLSWETRYPIILPKKHPVTQLIIKQAHEHCLHAGTNQVLSHLSAKYWILSAREAIREWEKECRMCRRRKAMPACQVMAPLPTLRTQMSLRAFSQTSVDYGGPFITKQGRGKARLKRYLCLFTCLATRAVHLELAYSLDTDAFLNAFYRMVLRRGLPQDMLSDNGTNFIGGERELRELVLQMDKDKIQNSTANSGVKWHFNPPATPHFSGVHEAMIKSAKKAIYGILGDADITDEELLSAVVGAEGLINSRPLTFQSANASDTIPLTPNHFLHGQVGGQFAPESVDTTDFSPRKRWRRVQELVRHFWTRWMREWLPTLSARKKRCSPKDDLAVGDVVLMLSADTQRGKWPLGRITDVFPGRDGHIRATDVL